MNNRVDYLCAQQGIPMLPPHPKDLGRTNTPIVGDTPIWEVAGLAFTKKEDAENVELAISLAKPRTTKYAPEGHYTQRIIMERIVEVDVSKKFVFTEAGWADYRQGEARKTKLRKERDEAMIEYSRIKALRNPIVDQVEAEEADERDAAALEARRINAWTRYLELADGNKDVAAKFLGAACEDAGLGDVDEIVEWIESR